MGTRAVTNPCRSWVDGLDHGGGFEPENVELQSRNPRGVANSTGLAHGDGIGGRSELQPAPGLFGMPELVMGHGEEQRVVRRAVGAVDLDRPTELPEGLLESAGAVANGAERGQPASVRAVGNGRLGGVNK